MLEEAFATGPAIQAERHHASSVGRRHPIRPESENPLRRRDEGLQEKAFVRDRRNHPRIDARQLIVSPVLDGDRDLGRLVQERDELTPQRGCEVVPRSPGSTTVKDCLAPRMVHNHAIAARMASRTAISASGPSPRDRRLLLQRRVPAFARRQCNWISP
jgi:hypothetical protein